MVINDSISVLCSVSHDQTSKITKLKIGQDCKVKSGFEIDSNELWPIEHSTEFEGVSLKLQVTCPEAKEFTLKISDTVFEDHRYKYFKN